MISTQANCTDNPEFGSVRVDDAIRAMLTRMQTIQGFEFIPLQEACGRILYKDIISPLKVPPKTNSAMDGFAIQGTDIPAANTIASLEIVGSAFAGKPCEIEIRRGQAVKIMTGAAIPAGTDTVVMQEQAELRGNTLHIDSRHRAGQNVRLAGEDIQQGQTVLSSGHLCTPADVGLIASLGLAEICVFRQLRIAVFSTGDELKDLGSKQSSTEKNHAIFDSNRYSLLAALSKLPVQALDMGIIPDDAEQLKAGLLHAANIADLIITSGGVSVGEADFTKQVLAEIGEINFWTVTMKPGRPIAFGNIGDAALFGLPGNPVAVMVTFYFLLLPCIEKLCGAMNLPPKIQLSAISQSKIRKRPGRSEFQRGILQQDDNQGWIVSTTGQQGSGILSSMSRANTFILLEHDQGEVEIGDRVTVLPFSNFF